MNDEERRIDEALQRAAHKAVHGTKEERSGRFMRDITYWGNLCPSIHWREPLLIQWSDRETYACRVCIANHGLKWSSQHQWSDIDLAIAHIAKEHP